MGDRKFLPGAPLVISAPLFCFCMLLPLSVSAQTSRFDLYIGYRLPTNSDLASSARKAQGDFIQQRALTLHGCGEDSECQKDAEIGFRQQIATVAQFWLAKCPAGNCDHVEPFIELTADQAVDGKLDQNFEHIERAGSYSSIGLYLELTSSICTLRKISDQAEVPSPPGRICDEIRHRYRMDFLEAIDRDDLDHVKQLIAAGMVEVSGKAFAFCSGGIRRFHNCLPIGYAAQRGRMQAVALLLENGADPNPGLAGAIANNHPETVRMLLDHGAQGGPLSLMEAVLKSDADLVRLLVKRGANVNKLVDPSETPGFLTALDVAVNERNIEMVKLLLSLGANVGLSSDRERFGRFGPDAASTLIFAVRGGDKAVVGLILAHGANVNYEACLMPRCRRPLGEAVSYGHAQIVALLLSHGADPNLVSNGEWPLIEAVSEGSVEMVKLLVGRGAHTSVKNSRGLTPLALAEKLGHPDIVQYLRWPHGK